jgi:tetratricopeptide (TPR) repeat protein
MRRFWLIFFPFFTLFAEVKICVVITANFSENLGIRDCLKSVESLIDAACILDYTTSTWVKIDANELFNQTNILGSLYSFEGQSESNPSLAIQMAKTMLQELNFPLESTYLLLLNSDMRLQLRGRFDKNQLEKDAYLILQKSPELSYCTYRPHLIRASLDWQCDSPLYEIQLLDQPFTLDKLKNFTIEGGDVLYEIPILEEALQKNPNQSSYLFHLAQKYRGTKRIEEAIELYREKIARGNEEEEIWFAKYMIGSCYEELGEWNKALFWYLDAYQEAPDRPDSLLKIASHYRFLGQNDLALIFAQYGAKVGPPLKDPNLFNYPPLKDYHFDQEISIAAYYTRFKNEGFAATSNLLIRKNVPWWIRDQSGKNILFYIQNLKNARFLPIEPDLPLIEETQDERYHPMNPSIVKIKNGYWVNCRAVNYTQMGAKIFNTIDSQGIFRTKNFLIEYTSDFKTVWEKEVVEVFPKEHLRALYVEGLEDLRIFFYQGGLWATCTTFDTNPTGQPQISLCKLDPTSCEKMVLVESLTPLLGPDPHRCEKNWLPFVEKEELQVIYSYGPFIKMTPDIRSGKYVARQVDQPPFDLAQLRGSAGPIPFENGYLVLVHEVLLFPDFSRCYIHRFLKLSADFVLEKISDPFVFQHQGVEYCCSMTFNHAENELILAVGIEDNKAYLCFVDLKTVSSILHALPEIHSDDFP